MIVHAQWGDAAETFIIAERADGAAMAVPVDAANADYRRIVEGDVLLGFEPLPIAPFQRWPDLSEAQAALRRAVYAEASRRVDAVTDDGEADPRRRREQLLMAAIVITRKEMQAEALTAEEETTKAVAEAVETLVRDIQIAEAVKKAEIDALADLAAAAAYDVAAGWP